MAFRHLAPTLASATMLAVVVASDPTAAQQRGPWPRENLPAVEAAFWQCDYEASERGIDAVDVDTCAAVYEMLKQRRFAGDFDRLLQWWEHHRAREHARLRESARRTARR